jgi:hypothetical protein
VLHTQILQANGGNYTHVANVGSLLIVFDDYACATGLSTYLFYYFNLTASMGRLRPGLAIDLGKKEADGTAADASTPHASQGFGGIGEPADCGRIWPSKFDVKFRGHMSS